MTDTASMQDAVQAYEDAVFATLVCRDEEAWTYSRAREAGAGSIDMRNARLRAMDRNMTRLREMIAADQAILGIEGDE